MKILVNLPVYASLNPTIIICSHQQHSDTALTNKISEELCEYRYNSDGKDGWNYLLISYDENHNGTVDENEKISYDKIGNPIVYRGADKTGDGSMSYSEKH